jgi:hypothetical protein
MTELLAPDVWPLIALAAVWWVLSLLPVFYSTFVAFRTTPAMPRRPLFVAVVACLSYGLLIFFLFAISLPLSAFSVFIAPQLEASGELPVVGRWLAIASRFISTWGWFVVPLFLAIVSFKLARYLGVRWPQLVAGLGPNISSKPTPLRGAA